MRRCQILGEGGPGHVGHDDAAQRPDEAARCQFQEFHAAARDPARLLPDLHR